MRRYIIVTHRPGSRLALVNCSRPVAASDTGVHALSAPDVADERRQIYFRHLTLASSEGQSQSAALFAPLACVIWDRLGSTAVACSSTATDHNSGDYKDEEDRTLEAKG